MPRVLLLLVGIAVLAVGLGLGPRHALVDGTTVTSVLGFALVAAGCLAVAMAVRAILRPLRRRWWLAVIPAVVVVAYVGLWSIGIAVAASYPPHPALDGRTPHDLGLAYRDVTFPAADGVRLSGWYLPTTNGAAVALLHGSGSTRTSALDQAAVLASAGYGVLLFDARGHGTSEGTGMDFGWYGEADTVGAVSFLSAQPGVTPGRIGLVGLSMGGEEAIGAAGVDDRVGAVVAEGATTRVSGDKDYLARYGVRGQIQRGIDWLTYSLVDLLSPAPRPATLHDSVIGATSTGRTTAFLLIAGERVPDEGIVAESLPAVAPDAVTVWIVPGAGHTQGLATAPGPWRDRVIAFLESALLSRT
jgi:pimeloyl-ACP methyl ester carboxylesterase